MSSLPLTVSVLGFSWDTTNAFSSPRWVCGLPECHLPSLPLILTGRKPSAQGVPCWFSGEESTCQCRRPKRHSFDPWVKISWSRKCQPMPVFLPGKFYEQKSLAGYSPGGWSKNGTLLSIHAFHACMHIHTHQHFGHQMWRTDILENTLMLGKIEGRGEGADRGWDGWMTSLTGWTCFWAGSGSLWWILKPGMLQSMGLKESDMTEWPNWTEQLAPSSSHIFAEPVVESGMKWPLKAQSTSCVTTSWETELINITMMYTAILGDIVVLALEHSNKLS